MSSVPYDHLVRAIRRRVEATPRAVALRHEVDGRWEPSTFEELGQRVDAAASWLIAQGIAHGDRVAIFAPNSPWWTVADLAVLAVGAVTVPVYATSNASAVGHVVRDAGARVVFVEGAERVEALEALRRDGHVRQVVVLDRQEAPRGEGLHRGVDVFGHPAVPELSDRAASLAAGDVATIVYTSGTTGEPKGVVLTHANLLTQFVALDTHFEVGPGDRSLCFLPLSHMYERAWSFYVLLKGAENYYLADPKRVSEVMPVVRPTCMVSVPRLFEKVCATARHRASGSPVRLRLFDWALGVGERYHEARATGRTPGLATRLAYSVADRLVLLRIRDAVGGPKRVFSAGGAALSSDVERFFFSAGLLVCQGYGLTETSPMLTCNRPRDFRFGTVGKPIPGCELRIAEDGEVLARGLNVMQGYFGRPRETAEAFDGEWFRTGDLGEFDPDGFLKIVGRKKELIITSGGKNVAPSLVEAAIGRDYYVEQVAAIGDGRPFLAALVVPQFEALQEWARGQGIARDSLRALSNDPRVRAFMAARIDAQQAMLAAHERVKRFTLLPERFSQAGGEITPTLKNVRKVIHAKYADLIEAMYRSDPGGQSE
jgi:long-chain acyl-CoA synthetase